MNESLQLFLFCFLFSPFFIHLFLHSCWFRTIFMLNGHHREMNKVIHMAIIIAYICYFFLVTIASDDDGDDDVQHSKLKIISFHFDGNTNVIIICIAWSNSPQNKKIIFNFKSHPGILSISNYLRINKIKRKILLFLIKRISID